jgi:prepilin-type N-terminal cleavage/methylation domain-containing protein
MRRGFTLVELCYVLAIIAALAAVAVPTYDVILRRAHVVEARAILHTIAHAELQHFRDRGSYLACGPFGEVVHEPTAFPWDEPCWRQLGVQAEGQQRYRYAVALQDESFVVIAEGDLDGDGVHSRLTLDGRDLDLQVVDELE